MMNGLPFKADQFDETQIFGDPPFTSSSYGNSGDPAATVSLHLTLGLQRDDQLACYRLRSSSSSSFLTLFARNPPGG